MGHVNSHSCSSRLCLLPRVKCPEGACPLGDGCGDRSNGTGPASALHEPLQERLDLGRQQLVPLQVEMGVIFLEDIQPRAAVIVRKGEVVKSLRGGYDELLAGFMDELEFFLSQRKTQ